jgi:adenylate kinase family enzyme
VDYYLVFSQSATQKGLTYDIIDDFDNDRTISMVIDYQARCLPHKEENVVEALYDSNTLPSVVLEKKIEYWVKTFTTRRENEFIDNYQENIKELQNNMEQRAKREVFLSIKFRLTSNIQLPESISIRTQNFSIQVTDYPKYLDCEVDGKLGVLDQKTAHNRRDQLEAIVEREIKTYMAKHVKLHDYYFGSEKQLILGIKKCLDEVLASQGRQVERLFIKREKPNFSNGVRDVTKEVKYQVQERSEPVTIVSTLLMELQDAGQYVAMGSPNLEEWVQRELDNIIPKELFGMKYIDLLLSFKPKEADIKGYMEKQAKSIGYSLRALLSVPNLEQLKHLKNFDIDVPGTLFPNKIDQAEAKLEIYATVRIQNLKDIETYLNQQQDIKQLMKEAIRNETKRFLRSIKPEDFYMRFGFSVDGEKGVEQNFIELPTERLSHEFKAVEEVKNRSKSKNGVEGETHIDGDIEDAEVISFNKPAQSPQSKKTETEKNKPDGTGIIGWDHL